MTSHKTPRPVPPDEQSTKTFVREATAEAAASGIRDAVERLTPINKPDGWGKDKRALVAWAGGLIGVSLLGWGVWITTSIFDAQRTAALTAVRIETNEQQSRERDKALAETAAERAAQIQLQLAQIQNQLAEIQRDLRHGIKP